MAPFQVNDRKSGKPQYHARMILALLVYAYPTACSLRAGSSARPIATLAGGS